MPVDDSELKDRLLLAASYGWSKPAAGTSVGDRLAGFLDADASAYDPEFTRQLQTVRRDWLSGSGTSLAGTLHHSVWTKPFTDEPTDTPGPTP